MNPTYYQQKRHLYKQKTNKKQQKKHLIYITWRVYKVKQANLTYIVD